MKWLKSLLVATGLIFAGMTAALAQGANAAEAPNVLIERVSNEVLDLLKKDQALRSGNIERVMEVVDEKVMPHVNFARMTALAVGPAWREATPEQRQQLQDEFELLLVRTYSGALDQVSQNQSIAMRPYRAAATDTDVTVNTEVRGQGNPVELSYRMRLENDQWKVYNVNVAGVWMVESYRSQFQPQLSSGGIDGLIKVLQERNRQNASGGK